VRVRGRKSNLRTLASQSLEASADLRSINKPGEVEITIRAQSINVPEDIEVVSIEPSKVRFRVEQLRQRAVPIRPYLEGTVPAGFIVGQATAEPALALCSGPASQIMKLAEVTTERIIMTGRTGPFVQSVAVISDSPLVRVLSPLTTQVTVPVLAEVGPEPPSDATETGNQ
jgi:YbbR domain-containing protein